MIVRPLFRIRFNPNLPQKSAKTAKNALPRVVTDARECNYGVKRTMAGKK
jgi:hypothetical protein